MKKQSLLAEEVITNKIYFLRNQNVMLDKDLATMYSVKPIRLREQVKRNLVRFPAHFMFQLNKDEVELMVSQNAIPSKKHLGGFLPYAFTEHGVLMLANVLKSKQAMDVSIRIIEVFIKMRQLLASHKDILLKLEQLEKKLIIQDGHVKKHENEIQLIFGALKELLNPPQLPRKQIGFKK